MNTLRILVPFTLVAFLGTTCGANSSTDGTGSGLDPSVEVFSSTLGAGWSASSTSTARTLKDYVKASDAVVEARLIGVTEGPTVRLDEQPDSPTLSFVYVRFRPVDTVAGTLRPDAAGEIRIEYPKPPGLTAANLSELIPGEPNAMLFVSDPTTAATNFAVPHVYLATGNAGAVVEGDSPRSPLVALANDKADGSDTAFGYETLSELRGAVATLAAVVEGENTVQTGPGPLGLDE